MEFFEITKDDEALIENNLCRSFYAVGISGNIAGILSEKAMGKESEKFNVDFYVKDGDLIGQEFGINAVVAAFPGHTKGLIGIYHNEDLYVGDTVMNYVYPSYPYICESPKEARISINKIHLFKPRRLFFGHGTPIKTAHNKQYQNLFSSKIIM